MIRWWREQMRLAREEARLRDLDRANRLRDRGRYAERVLRHLACAPDFDRASALFNEGRDDQAVAVMGKLAERLPESPDAHVERAFDADPEGIGHGAELAVAYIEDGCAEDALDVIARALEHHPGNERLLDIRARIQLD